jgi:hypothetical protein
MVTPLSIVSASAISPVHRPLNADRAIPPAVVEHLLHVGGREHRHLEVGEGELRLGGEGGALAVVVVTATASTPPLAQVPAKLACLKTSPVRSTPGRLAVPEAGDAVVARAGEEVDLLAAPDGGGGEILVQPLLEHHARGVEPLLGAARLLVEAASGEPR